MEAQLTFAAQQQQQQQNAFMMQSGGQGGNMGFQYPMSGIDYPGMNDVMCGRGMDFTWIVFWNYNDSRT